jgi:hypothetical protein
MKVWLALAGGWRALVSRGGKASVRPPLWSKI